MKRKTITTDIDKRAFDDIFSDYMAMQSDDEYDLEEIVEDAPEPITRNFRQISHSQWMKALENNKHLFKSN